MSKNKPISDFYTKDGVDKKAVEDYLKQLEEERKQYLKELQEEEDIKNRILNNAEQLKKRK